MLEYGKERNKMNVIPIEGAKKPLFSWCHDLEPQALEQMAAIMRLPFVEHASIMPDGHYGMENGAPIGSVIACKDVLVPNCIGVDSNCGMCAVKTSLHVDDLDVERKKQIHHSIGRSIPVGFSHNSDARRDMIEQKYSSQLQSVVDKFSENKKIADKKEIASQLGTLGGG